MDRMDDLMILCNRSMEEAGRLYNKEEQTTKNYKYINKYSTQGMSNMFTDTSDSK